MEGQPPQGSPGSNAGPSEQHIRCKPNKSGDVCTFGASNHSQPKDWTVPDKGNLPIKQECREVDTTLYPSRLYDTGSISLINGDIRQENIVTSMNDGLLESAVSACTDINRTKGTAPELESPKSSELSSETFLGSESEPAFATRGQHTGSAVHENITSQCQEIEEQICVNMKSEGMDTPQGGAAREGSVSFQSQDLPAGNITEERMCGPWKFVVRTIEPSNTNLNQLTQEWASAAQEVIALESISTNVIDTIGCDIETLSDDFFDEPHEIIAIELDGNKPSGLGYPKANTEDFIKTDCSCAYDEDEKVGEDSHGTFLKSDAVKVVKVESEDDDCVCQAEQNDTSNMEKGRARDEAPEDGQNVGRDECYTSDNEYEGNEGQDSAGLEEDRKGTSKRGGKFWKCNLCDVRSTAPSRRWIQQHRRSHHKRTGKGTRRLRWSASNSSGDRKPAMSGQASSSPGAGLSDTVHSPNLRYNMRARRSVGITYAETLSGKETESESEELCKPRDHTVTVPTDHTVTVPTSEMRFPCNNCDKSFKDLRTLKRHMRLHSGFKQFTCPICNRGFKLTQYLTIHLRTHAEDRPYTCEVCGKGFKERVHLKTHMRIHTGERPYVCSICNKGYTQGCTLRIHMRIHTGEMPFSCSTCGKLFRNEGNLVKHNLIHTGKRPYGCDTCGKRFTENGALKRHLRVHTGERPYTCQTCGKSFTETGSLGRHMVTHTSLKPYKCDTCGKSFKLGTQLKIHFRTHTGERPFKCEICGKRSTTLSNLKVHIMTHTKEKPYACNNCGKRFAHLSNMQKHMMIHTGEKPYSCEICDMSFSQAGGLKVHQMRHSGDKPYVCSTCTRGFSQANLLKRHQVLHHRTS